MPHALDSDWKKPATELIENMDELDIDDLEILDSRYREFAITSMSLARFARVKIKAIQKRQAGLINDALMLENECEEIYKRLPAWARW